MQVRKIVESEEQWLSCETVSLAISKSLPRNILPTWSPHGKWTMHGRDWREGKEMKNVIIL